MTPDRPSIRRGTRSPRHPHLWGAAALCLVFALTGVGFGVLGGGAVVRAGQEESRAAIEERRRHDDVAASERSARETGGLLRHVRAVADGLAAEAVRACGATGGSVLAYSSLGDEGLRLASGAGDAAYALGWGGAATLERLESRRRALAPALRAALPATGEVAEVRVAFDRCGVAGAPSARLDRLRNDAEARVRALRALDEGPEGAGWTLAAAGTGEVAYSVPFASAAGDAGVVTVVVSADALRNALGSGMPGAYPSGALLMTDRGEILATAGDPVAALGCESAGGLAEALLPLLGNASRLVPRSGGHHRTTEGRRLAASAVPETPWSAAIVSPMRAEAFDDAPSGAVSAAESFGWAVAGLSFAFGAVLIGTVLVVESAERRRVLPLLRVAEAHAQGDVTARAETQWDDLAPLAEWINAAGKRIRQAATRADESERRVTELVETLADGLVVTDVDDRIVHINQRFADLVGRTRVSVLGRYVEELLLPGSIARQRDETRRRTEGQATRYDLAWHAAKGVPVRTLVAGIPIFDADRRLTGSYLVVSDVTDRARREEETARAEKLHALGEMAGGVAHDFNNVLTVILGNAQFLLLEDLPPEVEQTLRTIEKATLEGTEAVRRIRQFSKVRSAPVAVQPVDPSAIVGEVIEESRKRFLERPKQGPAELEVEIALNSRRRVMGCPEDLREALGHVVRNALEAMPRGGRLVVETFDRGEDAVGIRIEDTGPGMPPEVERKIFDPFFTTKEGGRCAGLGLSIAFGIVRAHRGRIDVRTAPGCGSTFTIVLPAAVVAAADDPGEADSPRRKLPTDVQPRVLLVAGANADAEDLEEGLREFGLYVASVAPAAVPTVVADPDLFNVLLVEHDLGGASTGWEIARQARTQRADLRVLLLAAPFHDVSETQARNAGIDRVVHRPFDARDLHGEIFSAMVAPPARLGQRTSRAKVLADARPGAGPPEARSSQRWSAHGALPAAAASAVPPARAAEAPAPGIPKNGASR